MYHISCIKIMNSFAYFCLSSVFGSEPKRKGFVVLQRGATILKRGTEDPNELHHCIVDLLGSLRVHLVIWDPIHLPCSQFLMDLERGKCAVR